MVYQNTVPFYNKTHFFLLNSLSLKCHLLITFKKTVWSHIWPDLDANCLTYIFDMSYSCLMYHIPEKKVDFEKKISRQQKKIGKFSHVQGRVRAVVLLLLFL